MIAWERGWFSNQHSPASLHAMIGPDRATDRSIASKRLEQQSESNRKSCQHVYEIVCRSRTDNQDPTGSVRPDEESEQAAHTIYRDIIRAHPEWTNDLVDEEFVKRVYTPQNRAKIHSAFYRVKRAIYLWIDLQPESIFTIQEKSQIKDRIRKVELELPPPALLYEDEPDLLSKSELIYERKINGKMALRVGGAYLLFQKSWFNIIFSLAHELGHAIDPCEIRGAGLSFPAYDRLVGCFLEHHLVELRNTRSECWGGDQLSETFADWVAVHITAEILGTYSSRLGKAQLLHAAQNSVRDLCDSDLEGAIHTDLEFHPSPKIRINEIFGRHPQMRTFLGCEPTPASQAYCQLTPKPLPNSGGLVK